MVELHFRSIEEDVDGGAQLPVHAAGVGNQPDAFSQEFFKAVFPEDFNAGNHLCLHP